MPWWVVVLIVLGVVVVAVVLFAAWGAYVLAGELMRVDRAYPEGGESDE